MVRNSQLACRAFILIHGFNPRTAVHDRKILSNRNPLYASINIRRNVVPHCHKYPFATPPFLLFRVLQHCHFILIHNPSLFFLQYPSCLNRSKKKEESSIISSRAPLHHSVKKKKFRLFRFVTQHRKKFSIIR